MPAATLAFFSNSSATKRSLGDACNGAVVRKVHLLCGAQLACLSILQDVRQLLQVAGAQEVGDVTHRLARQQAQRLWSNLGTTSQQPDLRSQRSNAP
jgi:hypothetical protein